MARWARRWRSRLRRGVAVRAAAGVGSGATRSQPGGRVAAGHRNHDADPGGDAHQQQQRHRRDTSQRAREPAPAEPSVRCSGGVSSSGLSRSSLPSAFPRCARRDRARGRRGWHGGGGWGASGGANGRGGGDWARALLSAERRLSPSRRAPAGAHPPRPEWPPAPCVIDQAFGIVMGSLVALAVELVDLESKLIGQAQTGSARRAPGRACCCRARPPARIAAWRRRLERNLGIEIPLHHILVAETASASAET